MLWGVARCEAKKSQIVVGRGQVFRDMVEAVVRRAEVIIAGRGLPVNYSMLLWALGSINFHPGRDFFRKMLDTIASRQLLDDFDAQVQAWPRLLLPPATITAPALRSVLRAQCILLPAASCCPVLRSIEYTLWAESCQ